MSTSKRFKTLILILSIVFAIAGFNSTSMAGTKTLKFGHYADNNYPLGKAAQRFVMAVEERTRGQVKINLYPRSQLGSARTMLKETQSGNIHITLAPVIYLRSYAPKMDALELPFLFRNYGEVDRIFREKNRISEQLFKDLERVNMKGLAFWEVGFRYISTSRRPIKGPWDLKGLKIRTYSNQALIQAFKLLGANPIVLPPSELFQALQMGVVDGQEGSIDTFYRLKLYQTQKYLCLTRHLYTALVLVMNSQTFRGLSPEQQRSVEYAAFEAADYGRDLSRKFENDKIYEFEKMGLQIVKNTDWDGFRKRVFYEVQEKFVREEGRRMLKEIDRTLH